jgi:diacylglycerol O-acyltransferase / wax synthase
MEQLSGQDASFVYLETPTTPMHIGSVGIYDPSSAPGGFVRFKDILAHIESRLDKARSFRQKLVRVPFDLDHPYWVDDANFDLEYHVRHVALPKPGDWRQLCIQVARLHARGMDMNKPLWEFNIVEGLDNIPGLPPVLPLSLRSITQRLMGCLGWSCPLLCTTLNLSRLSARQSPVGKVRTSQPSPRC